MKLTRKQRKLQSMPLAAIAPPEPIKLSSVTRSYSRKLQLERIDPALKYESIEFFASQTAHCEPDKLAEASKIVASFVRKEVIDAFNAEIDYILADRDARKKTFSTGAPR